MKPLKHITYVDGGLYYDGERLQFPGFEIDGLCGRGANGIVLSAKDSVLDRRVAIKVWDSPVSPVNLNRAVGEARKLAGVSHPLFVTVHRFDRVGRAGYAVLEFVSGSTAEEWRKDSERSVADRVAFWRLYARALRILHSAGTCHGDPHTKNVMVFPDPEGTYSGLHGISGTSAFGLKMMDVGTSLLRRRHALIQTREVQVIRETGERLWHPVNVRKIIESQAHESVSFVMSAFDHYSEFRRHVDLLKKQPPTDADEQRSSIMGLGWIVSRFPFFDLAEVTRFLQSQLADVSIQDLLNQVEGYSTWQLEGGANGSYSSQYGRRVSLDVVCQAYFHWRQHFLAFKLTSLEQE